MDVRCERCRAQYVFDDEQVTPSGLTVQCTNCGHVFRVKKKELVVTVPVKPDEMDGAPIPATAAAPRGAGATSSPPEADRPREWRVRQANGNIFTFRELTTLQKWIIEQKVSRDDEISLAGEQWKRLGNIAELASFFQVVEAAERGRSQPPPPPAVTPLPAPAAPAYGVAVQSPGFRPPPPPSGFPPPSFAAPRRPPAPAPEPPPEPPAEPDLGPEVDLEPEEIAAVKKGRAGRILLALLLLAGAAGAAAWFLAPELFVFERRPPPPEALEVPITIQVKPEEPSPPAPSEPPAGAEATIGEPTVSLAPATPPEPEPPAPGSPAPPAADPGPAPAPAAEPKPPPAPRGPKALLAQAHRLRERGDVSRALELYGRVVSSEPDNVEALTGRGLCYLDLESYPPAEASFQAALRIEPDEPDALLGLAETYRWQGRKNDAIKYYERYLAAHPAGEEAGMARNALQELRN